MVIKIKLGARNVQVGWRRQGTTGKYSLKLVSPHVFSRLGILTIILRAFSREFCRLDWLTINLKTRPPQKYSQEPAFFLTKWSPRLSILKFLPKIAPPQFGLDRATSQTNSGLDSIQALSSLILFTRIPKTRHHKNDEYWSFSLVFFAWAEPPHKYYKYWAFHRYFLDLPSRVFSRLGSPHKYSQY